ncbi:hypothetical protein [Ilumatobacter sp.]|uniref:ATP-binding protein n=1 Tax=Ilumatobacter sp. TaxID=1967498 RepID=UPI003AF7F57B
MTQLPRLAVFDAELPPSIAFARSLGRHGVPVVAYSPRRFATTKLSRHVSARRSCPPVYETDEFVGWLIDEIAADRFDLIAMTSDFAAFNVMEAFERSGTLPHGYPSPAAVRTCLFKDAFQKEMTSIGFPVPPAFDTTEVDEAIGFARSVGYPVVLKPRSHAGVGIERGTIAHDDDELREFFVPYELDEGQGAVLRHNPQLAYPLVQKLLDSDEHEVVSVTGVLGIDGEVLAVGHSRKLGRWPGRLGVGTIFEPTDPEPFTDHALDAVRSLLGRGIFELEVVVHRPTGEYWGIDLNPRAYGQIALDIGLGNDLPALWYESVTGVELPPVRPSRVQPTYWHQGVPVWVGAAVEVASGSGRADMVRQLYTHQRAPHVGSVSDLSDPLPGLAMGWSLLRHPRSLVRSVSSDGLTGGPDDS